jgi:Dockerin type I domain
VGHVTWQGPPPQPDVRQQLPISLTLRSGASEVNYSPQTTDASGFFSYTVASLPPGEYEWRVKGPKYLANCGIVTLTGSGVTPAEMGLMRVGDANNDNVINAMDFTILKSTFGKSMGDPGYDDRADFNGDQVVNTADFTLLRGNFASSGCP